MLLRKINAAISLVTTVLLLVHAIFFSIWMLSGGSIAKSADNIPWILAGLMLVHAILSIVLAILGKKGAVKQKCNTYPKMNIPTFVQRITGIMMIVLLGIHVAGSFNHFQPKILHVIAQPLFFSISMAHISISTSKAFISLGLGNAKIVKIIDIVMRIICTMTILASVTGFCLCLFVGVSK